MHAAATQRLVDRNVQSRPLRTPVERCQTCTLCVYYSPYFACLSLLCRCLSLSFVVVSLPPLSSAFINQSLTKFSSQIYIVVPFFALCGRGGGVYPNITQPDTCIF